MSKEFGLKLPDDLLRFLQVSEPEAKFHQVILFTTVDEDGWPRHGMLSPYEVVANNSHRIWLLLYKWSHSSQNLKRTGRVSLICINSDLSYYIQCHGRPAKPLSEAPNEILFELKVERVFEDSFPTARILTGITFEGYDPGVTPQNRRLVFERLRNLSG